jgi:hypothetical protein
MRAGRPMRRVHASKMPQLWPFERGSPVHNSLSWANLVGRDGIEPPTLRFSVVGPRVQQGTGLVIPLVT